MTRDEKLAIIWRHTHRDFKGQINGVRHVLIWRQGTESVPLTDLTDDEVDGKMRLYADVEERRLAKKRESAR